MISKAVILAGGLGTRMRHLTNDEIPKALVKLHGRTITEYSIDNLKEMGITDIVISIGHHSDQVKEYFGDGSRFGVRITYLVEEEPLGTGGWMNLADIEDFRETFMVVNGDDMLKLGMDGIRKFYDLHKKSKASVSIALTKTDNIREKGVADLDGSRIKRFVEKPEPEDAPSDLINTGNYLFEPEVLSLMPDQRVISLERDVFPVLASGGKLFGFNLGAEWYSIGTKDEYDKALQRNV